LKAPNSDEVLEGDSDKTYPGESGCSTEEFKREARVWARLTDNVPKSVVCLMDFNVTPCTWMVMELAQDDLGHALGRGEVTVPIFVNLLRKLQSIHNQGIVHRDIKPENILSVNGEWKFSDFGLSKLQTHKTTTGVAGTPMYMAPEQIDQKRFGHTDKTTDLWQMGILLYRMVIGKSPYAFADNNPISIMFAVCDNGPDLSCVPKDWLPVFEKAFQKDHSRRFQSADEFADAVESVCDDIPSNTESNFVEVDSVQNSEDLCRLGDAYYNGDGVTQSYAVAADYYRKSAEKGHVKAQFDLGRLYYVGKGVEQSDSEAVIWFRKAAEQGHPGAQFNLGQMYEYGRGVQRSDSEAVIWFRKAAEQGDAKAQFKLEWMYCHERGVSKTDAVKWFTKRAEQGDAKAQFMLGCIYEQGGGGIQQSYSEASRWYTKAAEQGHSDAQSSLICMYERGREVSDSEAVRWYAKSAEQGDAKAQFNLGLMYEEGRGVQVSYTEAEKWYARAAEQGHSRADKKLRQLRKKAKGIQKSNSETVENKKKPFWRRG